MGAEKRLLDSTYYDCMQEKGEKDGFTWTFQVTAASMFCQERQRMIDIARQIYKEEEEAKAKAEKAAEAERKAKEEKRKACQCTGWSTGPRTTVYKDDKWVYNPDELFLS